MGRFAFLTLRNDPLAGLNADDFSFEGCSAYFSRRIWSNFGNVNKAVTKQAQDLRGISFQLTGPVTNMGDLA